MLVDGGSYVSNGAAQLIEPTFGQPDYVRIRSRSSSRETVVATRDMPGGKSKLLTSSTALVARVTFDPTGFTVLATGGGNVNGNGETYDWLAIKCVAGESAIGYYDGAANGTDPVAVTGLGWDPSAIDTAIMISPDATKASPFKWPDRPSCLVSSGNDLAAGVTLDADGFTVGSDANHNGAGVRFYYLALKTGQANVEHGTYTSGASGTLGVARELTTAAWAPDYAVIQRTTASAQVERYGSLGATEGSYYLNTATGISGARLDTLVPSTGFGFKIDPAATGAEIWSTSVLTYHYLLLKKLADTTAPTVISVAPANAATGVALGAQVVLTFSKPMDAATLTGCTVKRTSGSVNVPYTGVYDAALYTWTMTPNSLLLASTGHTVTVPVTVEDFAGTAIASQFTSTFTTGTADTVPPTFSGKTSTATGTTTIAYAWTTNKLATSEIRYGPTSTFPGAAHQGADPSGWVHPAPFDTPPSGTRQTSHAYAATGLSASTSYTAQVRGSNADGYISLWSDMPAATTNAVSDVALAYLEGHANFYDLFFRIGYTGDNSNVLRPTHYRATLTAAAADNATSLTVAALPARVEADTYLVFPGGDGGVHALVTSAAAAGATTIAVAAIADPIAVGKQAMYSDWRYRVTGGGATWRYGFKLHPTRYTGDFVLAGSIFRVLHNTSYDFSVRFAVPGSAVSGPATLPTTRNDVAVTSAAVAYASGIATITFTMATKDDGATAWHNIDLAAATPTHYLSPAATGAGNGTVGAPWTVLQFKNFLVADAGTSDIYARVAPGLLFLDPTTLTNPTGRRVALYAETPAYSGFVSDTLAATTDRTIFYNGYRTAPSTAAWAPFVPTGQVDGLAKPQWTVWRHTPTGPLAAVTQSTGWLGYSATATGRALRIVGWETDTLAGSMLNDPNGFAELIHINESYRSGYWQYKGLANAPLYLKMPFGLDPNNYYISFSAAQLLTVNGPNIRISGFDFRGSGVLLQPQANGGVVDHCVVDQCFRGVQSAGIKPGTYASDQVFQDIKILDDKLWDDDPAHNPGDYVLPWNAIKGGTRMPASYRQSYLTTEPGYWAFTGGRTNQGIGRATRGTETSGIYWGGGAKRLYVRRIDLDGCFNGCGGNSTGFDKKCSIGMVVRDVRGQHMGDDLLEPEAAFPMGHFDRCHGLSTATFSSAGPLSCSFIKYFECTSSDPGPAGAGYDRLLYRPVGGKFLKPEGTALLYLLAFVNVSGWTAQGNVPGREGGGDHIAMFNSYIRMTKYAWQWNLGKSEEDFNHFATTDASRGLTYISNRFSVVPYRAASGQGANTNLTNPSFVDVTTIDNALTDPANGDLTLVAGSPFINLGFPVIGFPCSEESGYFSGPAPDLGGIQTATVDTVAATVTSGPTVVGTPTQTSFAATITLSKASYATLKVWVTAAGEGTATTVDHGFAAAGARALAASGLTVNTAYTFRVLHQTPASAQAQSGTATFSTDSAADTTAPVLSSFQTQGIGPDSANPAWQTDEDASSQVQYRVVGDLTWIIAPEIDTSTRLTVHAYPLGGLVSETDYAWQARSTDGSTNQSVFSATQTFTTRAYPPTLASVAPVSGLGAGGTTVVLTGTGFRTGAAVTFGGAAAPPVAVDSATQITASTPPGVAGLTSVVVTNLDGESATLLDAFTFTAPPPEDLPPTPIGGALVVQPYDVPLVFTTFETGIGHIEYGVGAAFNLRTPDEAALTTTHTGTLTVVPGRTYRWRYICTDQDGADRVSAVFTFDTVGATGRARRAGGLLRI